MCCAGMLAEEAEGIVHLTGGFTCAPEIIFFTKIQPLQRRWYEMAEHPLKIFEKLDPELLELVAETREFALADGALPRKFKLLIALSLDASHGAVEGVKALAQAALQAGATKEELTEALRVVHYVCGAGSVYTAAHALATVC
jgi:alkylhydroperoxidase/carboxymuconolactone decarboxylase family protein YurZ